MARDEEDDLFEDDIDFVDDDDFSDEEAEGDDDSDVEGDEEEAPAKKPRKKAAKKVAKPRETKKKAARAPRAKKPAEANEAPADAASADERAPAKKSSEIPKRAWDLADETPAPPRSRRAPREEIAAEPASDFEAPEVEAPEVAEQTDEFGRPAPLANYVVHVYEHQRLKRTIDRDFTPEDAELFAAEYSRTGKSYGRTAIAGKKDTEPKKRVDAVNKADPGPTAG